MKIKKTIILLILFSIMALFININSYGFSNGDKVKCKRFSYYYVEDWSNGVNPYLRGYKRQDEKNKLGLKKDTQVTFIKSMDKDGICRIKYKDKEHYIKEVNLSAVSSDLIPERAAQKVINKYKGKSVSDFINMGADKLKSASDECKIAYNNSYKTQTKLELNKIIVDMAEAAKKLDLQVNSDNTIEHQIPTVSTVPSGEQAWKNNMDKTKKEKEEEEKAGGETNEQIYFQPGQTGNGGSSSEQSIGDLIEDADDFVSSGSSDPDVQGVVKADSLQNFSKTFYNIFLEIGIAVAVIVGIIIGIKFMTGSVDEKANIKQLLVPYIVGCVVVFGAFGIWALVVNLLSDI